MRLDLISKYRTQLMGIAILWVMLFHSKIMFTMPFFIYIKKLGYGGVDIFMFLSGLGIYYSLAVKKETLKIFYKKRALRILPYYLPIVFLLCLFLYSHNIWNLKICLYNMTTLGFWLGYGFDNIFDWYVPSIIVLYLISPLFYKLFRYNKNLVTVFIIISYYTISFLVLGTKFYYLAIFTTRAPLYFAGFWFADYCINHKDAKLSPRGIIITISLLIIGFILLVYILYDEDLWMRNGLVRFPYGIATIPLCLVLSYLFSLFKNYKYPILSFFGTYTLVLYIFHERVMLVLNYYGVMISQILIFAIAIVLAVLWQKFVNKIIARFFI